MEKWLYILAVILHIAPFSLLRYYPFRRELRFPIHGIIPIYGLILVAEIGFAFTRYDSLITSGTDMNFWPYSGFFAGYILLSFYIIRMDVARQLYLWFPLAFYALTVHIIGVHAERAAREIFSLPRFLILDLAIIQILAATLPWVHRFVCRMEDFFMRPYVMLWEWGWIPTAALFCMNVLYANTHIDGSRALELMCVASFAVTALYLLFVLRLCHFFERQITLKQSIGMALELADKENRLGNEVRIQTERKETLYRHIDLWISRLQAAVNQKDVGAIRNVLQEEQAELFHSLPGRRFCNHPLLDAILSAAEERAKLNGIRTEISVSITKDLILEEVDICVLFGNLIENAMEACLALPVTQRWIKFKLGTKAGMIAILVENSCNSARVHEHDGIFYSAKRGEREPGIGISSISDVVNRYGGDIKFEHDGGIFRVTILGGGAEVG